MYTHTHQHESRKAEGPIIKTKIKKKEKRVVREAQQLRTYTALAQKEALGFSASTPGSSPLPTTTAQGNSRTLTSTAPILHMNIPKLKNKKERKVEGED